MELQVLVNHYRESEAVVSRFLSSLAMQRGVEFSVLLRTDGGVELDRAFLDGFGLDIDYRALPHAGVCPTRNAMLAEATADYVMFCDVDDCFCSDDGLLSLMAVARETGADVIGSDYLSEHAEGDGYGFSVYRRDTVRLHGKAFRRAYLMENGIAFPELETSGDMYFLYLAYSLTKKPAWLRNVFYIWKHNGGSVTRGEGNRVPNLERTVACYSLLWDELERRGRADLLANLASTVVPMMYLDSGGGDPAKVSEGFAEAVRALLVPALPTYRSLPQAKREAAYAVETACKRDCMAPEGLEGVIPWAERVMSGGKRDALIVGCGVVGTNLMRELAALEPDSYDKYKGVDTRNLGGYRVAFVCVDTPRTDSDPCDATEVRNAIMENDADVYVVKSTVLPGTTERLRDETGKRVVFSPEYYGATQHCNNFGFDFTILGGDEGDCWQVAQLLQRAYDGRHSFRVTDARTAELAKYMENCWLATKVSFCNQFARIAGQAGVRYGELRELFALDPRVNPSHTFVYEDRPYWQSHCLDKDVAAAAEAFDAPLLDAVIAFNEECKKEGAMR